MKNDSMIIRQGWPEDLEAMAAFIDSNLDYDSIGTDLLREKLTGDPFADPELCFTALQGDQITGFLFCVRRSIRGQEFGYVKLFAVAREWRRKKVGTALYLKAEQLLVSKGAEYLRWYDVPLNYFMPGIDPRYTEAFCFAEKHGFKKFGESVNMLCELTGKDFSTLQDEEALKNQGVVVCRAQHKDIPALRKLLEKEWALWNNEVDMAMSDNPPSVHIAFKDGALKAFSVHNGNNKGTGWFGPMGTHPDLRGLGIGTILLKRCLKDMQDQGYKKITIPWVAPIAFYSHFVEARIDRVFWRVEKQMKPSPK
ncbi:MAG: GNAT family N-acetyltransferase [Bacteroidales bacterium]|nr:GNAT family N-acetyltransferase [Bacteroidales bacterium]